MLSPEMSSSTLQLRMQDLKDIPGIGPKLLQLLEASGFSELEDLRAMSADQILDHLGETNKHHQLTKVLPTQSQIESWLERLPAAETVEAQGVNYESDPDILSMLEYAPIAEPVTGAQLMAGEVKPLDISEPIYLSNVLNEVEIRVGRRTTTPTPHQTVGIQKFESGLIVEDELPTVAPVDISRVKSVKDFQPQGEELEQIQKANEKEAKSRDERVKLLTTTRAETNKGRRPSSRRFIRGVLHPLPGRMYLGALISILGLTFIPLALIAGLALFINDSLGKPSLPEWLLIFPLLLPVFGILWIIVAPGCRCRVCGQKLFLPKNCLKHRNAHKLPLIGYIFPTALHMLSFKWFRCIFCGTPIRLKE